MRLSEVGIGDELLEQYAKDAMLVVNDGKGKPLDLPLFLYPHILNHSDLDNHIDKFHDKYWLFLSNLLTNFVTNFVTNIRLFCHRFRHHEHG